jgi:hypothetical protein
VEAEALERERSSIRELDLQGPDAQVNYFGLRPAQNIRHHAIVFPIKVPVETTVKASLTLRYHR